jgi:hypothetical protein
MRGLIKITYIPKGVNQKNICFTKEKFYKRINDRIKSEKKITIVFDEILSSSQTKEDTKGDKNPSSTSQKIREQSERI